MKKSGLDLWENEGAGRQVFANVVDDAGEDGFQGGRVVVKARCARCGVPRGHEENMLCFYNGNTAEMVASFIVKPKGMFCALVEYKAGDDGFPDSIFNCASEEELVVVTAAVQNGSADVD